MVNHITRENWRSEATRQGITLAELARRTGISARAIYGYSRGERQPTDAWIERVGVVLTVLNGARVA